MSSMAGGCEVMFYGQGMAMDPSMISVVFENREIGNVNMGTPNPCKFLVQNYNYYFNRFLKYSYIVDIAFNSVTNGGSLKYSTPAVAEMYQGATYEDFNTLDSVTYVASLLSFSESTGQTNSMACRFLNWCWIKFSRAYTPILH